MILQHTFLIAKHVLKWIPSQVNVAEVDAEDMALKTRTQVGIGKAGVPQGHFEPSCT